MPKVQRVTETATEVPVPAGERRKVAQPETSFTQNLNKAKMGTLRERLHAQLVQLDELGGRLAKEMTIANLKAYKGAVKQFLQDLQKGAVSVQTSTEFDYQAWQERSLTIVEKVDEELEELGRLVLNHEQDRLKILEKIGEIKGLLLDIRI